MTDWFEHLDTRAPKGGEIGVNGVCYQGGEFMPFYIPRPVMPQIDEADYPDLFAFADAEGVSIVTGEDDPRLFRAHQHVDRIRVESLTEDLLRKPALVSVDRFVLDGNHRWAGHVAKATPMPYHELLLPFDLSMKFLFAFPKTYMLETVTEIRN